MTDNEELPTLDSGQPVEWITLADAARRVDMSTKTIRRHVKGGTLVGQRSGTGNRSPWMIRTDSLHELYPDAAPAGTPATSEAVTALSQQLEAVTELLADANTQTIEATERAAIAETRAEHYQERLADLRDETNDLRDQLETARAEPKKRRGWWRR